MRPQVKLNKHCYTTYLTHFMATKLFPNTIKHLKHVQKSQSISVMCKHTVFDLLCTVHVMGQDEGAFHS